MGGLGQSVRIDAGRRSFKRLRWARIQERVQALALDWPGVKVYQDGLPNTEAAILNRILTEVPGPNYDLLRWLVGKGAELVGSESPVLLKEEYHLLPAVLAAKEARARARARRAYADRASALLAERDAYIACRIAETLPLLGVGVVFIGHIHRLIDHLPADIAVQEFESLNPAALK
ncbi:MAG: hypothetical protein Q7T05_01085 [Dehalococcoidia bacterium]|nr:hypothetical protein [Dehalococcoidia bacterium]